MQGLLPSSRGLFTLFPNELVPPSFQVVGRRGGNESHTFPGNDLRRTKPPRIRSRSVFASLCSLRARTRTIGRRQRVVRPSFAEWHHIDSRIYSIVAASGLAPTCELPENVRRVALHLIVGDPKSKGSRFFNRRSARRSSHRDALVEDDVAPGLFRRNVSLRVDDTSNTATSNSSAMASRTADAHEAFEALAWSMAKLDGGDEFLAGLHRLFRRLTPPRHSSIRAQFQSHSTCARRDAPDATRPIAQRDCTNPK